MTDKKSLDKVNAKRDAVTGQKKKGPNVFSLIAIAAIMGVSIFFILTGNSDREPGEAVAATTRAAAQVTEVSYPVSDFADGEARFFQYKTKEGVAIRYFILKSSDGTIRAAFDACDACWRAGKGYHQEGDEMVCNNCRMRFASVKINEVKGGCNPSPLKRTVVGDKVVIKSADIEQGVGYFNFEGLGGGR